MGQAQEVIDVQSWEVPIDEITNEQRANVLVRFFRACNRKFRRAVLFSKRKFWRFVASMPPGLRRSMAYAAAFVGYFAAWMLFYASILIAFSYGMFTGFAVLAVWGLLIGYILQRTDPAYAF